MSHDKHPDTAEQIGEAAGGISGALTGAAIGSVGGPIGTVIGGIAGAIGGWWAGRAVSEAAESFTHEHDTHYRARYDRSSSKLADRSYEDVRPAYQLGHLAARNPSYDGRPFHEVEADLRKGWSDEMRSRHGEWDSIRPYAEDAFELHRAKLGEAGRRAEEADERRD